eukprot:PhM_4_TR18804/c0_g1_i2/m.91494
MYMKFKSFETAEAALRSLWASSSDSTHYFDAEPYVAPPPMSKLVVVDRGKAQTTMNNNQSKTAATLTPTTTTMIISTTTDEEVPDFNLLSFLLESHHRHNNVRLTVPAHDEVIAVDPSTVVLRGVKAREATAFSLQYNGSHLRWECQQQGLLDAVNIKIMISLHNRAN